MNEIITKNDIAHMVKEDTGFSLVEINAIINSFLNNIEKSVADGYRVQFRGFGAFETRERAARIGHSLSGNRIDIPAKVIPWFLPGDRLKRTVAKEK